MTYVATLSNAMFESVSNHVLTAVCRIMFDLPVYSSKRPILRVMGGAEGVVPHPHKSGSK